LKVISLPFLCVSILCYLSSFNDHLFCGSNDGCGFRGTSGGWGSIY